MAKKRGQLPISDALIAFMLLHKFREVVPDCYRTFIGRSERFNCDFVVKLVTPGPHSCTPVTKDPTPIRWVACKFSRPVTKRNAREGGRYADAHKEVGANEFTGKFNLWFDNEASQTENLNMFKHHLGLANNGVMDQGDCDGN